MKVVAIVVAFVAIFLLSRHVIGARTTATTTTAPTAQTTTTGVTTTSLAADTCNPDDFSGAYDEGEGAAGTVYASVTLTKTTTGTCTLSGWPRLTLEDRLGGLVTIRQVDVPSAGNSFHFLIAQSNQYITAQANQAPANLSLTQNQTATFALAYTDVATGGTSCPSAVNVSVQFVASGTSIPVTAPYPVSPCNGGQIWVSPFFS